MTPLEQGPQSGTMAMVDSEKDLADPAVGMLTAGGT